MSAKNKYTKAEREAYQEKFKIQFFEQPSNVDKHNYVRLTHYMLHHKNYLSLSSSSKILLTYMRDWAFGCADYWKTGKFEYSSTMLENIGIMSRTQTIRSFKELRQKGFINAEHRHGAGAISRWSFSDRWYTGKPEEYSEEQDEYISIKHKIKYPKK